MLRTYRTPISFVLLGAAALVLSCQPAESPSSKELSIGVIMPLTGNVASLGVPCFNGMRLALDTYQKAHPGNSPKIELVAEDSNADAKTAVSAFDKLITVNHASAILGPLTSTEALAVAPLAERRHVVMISPGASTPNLSTAGDYIFRNELSDLSGGSHQARIAHDRLKFRRVAVLYMNNAYGVGLHKVFSETFSSLGGSIPTAQAFQPDTVDFRSHLSKIKAANPDALLIVAVDEIVNIIKQAKELDLKTRFFTTPIFENQTYLEQLGPLAEGVLYVYYGTFDPQGGDKNAAEFVRLYKDRFGDPPTYYSALGYDAAGLLLTALRNGNFEGQALKDQLYAIKNFPGVTGPSSFNEQGDIEKPVILKTVSAGRFIFLR